jgi:uncharacterized protein
VEQPTSSTQPELPRDYYWKRYTCPLSGYEFSTVAVKARSYSVRERGTDFAPSYDGINPQYYEIIVSPVGFAAEESVYRRSPQLLFRDREGLVDSLKELDAVESFAQIRDLPLACRAYELALSCTAFMRVPRYEIASLALRASWLFREWFEDGYEPAGRQIEVLREIALSHYQQAYEKEDVTKLKLGSAGVAYLIAELLRERGEFADSLRWFSRVTSDKSAGSEVLRIARNQMETCREQRKQAMESGSYIKPELERRLERTVFQVYADQARWLSKLSAAGGLMESEFVRSVLDGLRESGTDFSAYSKAEDLTQLIKARLGKPSE